MTDLTRRQLEFDRMIRHVLDNCTCIRHVPVQAHGCSICDAAQAARQTPISHCTRCNGAPVKRPPRNPGCTRSDLNQILT